MLPAPADGSAPGFFGVYPGFVTDLVDPQGLGRIEVRFPWLGQDGDQDVRGWATLCSPYADNGHGLQILPEVDSQVLLAFEAGSLRRPYIIGSAWNGRASLPQHPEPDNNIRVLRSREDSLVEFDDTKGAVKVTISTSDGHEIVIDQGASEITVQHAAGCLVRLTATTVDVQANSSVEVNAPMVNVTASTTMFSGNAIVQGSVFAGSFVVSPAYTPGVGNLL